jgi:hypothetical protein
MQPFLVPNFDPWALLYAAAGSAALYTKLATERRRVLVLSRIIDLGQLAPLVRSVIELIVFVGIGCFIAVSVVQPSNVQQAIAAGMSWTGLFTIPSRAR